MEELQAIIEDITHDGLGIARVDNLVYFVPGALPGEDVCFVPGRKKKGQRGGDLVRINSASPRRVRPQCEYFGTCGGCALQHADPGLQLGHKQKLLLDNLERIGGVSPGAVLDPIEGPPWNYRRKARLGIRHVPKKGGILVGFRERGSSFITSLQHCRTLDSRLSALLPGFHRLVSGMTNNHRIPQIEVAAGDNGVDLVFRHLEPLADADVALLEAFAAEHRVNVYLQPGGADSIHPLFPARPQPLYTELKAFGVRLEFGAADFVQVNDAVNQRMVTQALDLLDVRPGERVLDLFCGLGNFTLAMGARGAHAVGVEGDGALVDRAAANARLNGLDNLRFEKRNLFDEEAGLNMDGGFDKVLLDPPRSGALHVVTRMIPAAGPQTVVYVSCNPSTLARDAAVLVRDHGYTLTHAGVINMFPHTAHVESMAVFKAA